jgi:HSP20 family molecular chaperone IbpA
MRQNNTKTVFLLPKTTEKVGTAAAIKNISMWYNYKTVRYTYEPSDKEIVFNFELPGKAKEDVKVFCKNSLINIKVKDKDNFNIDLDEHSHSYDSDEYDVNKITAKMLNGMLTVKVPKKEENQRVIEIS